VDPLKTRLVFESNVLGRGRVGHPTATGSAVVAAEGTVADLRRPPRTGPVVRVPTGVFERSNWQRHYAARLRATDALVVVAAVLLAQLVRFGTTPEPPGYPRYFIPIFSTAFAIAWLYALSAVRSRSPRLIGNGVEEYRRVISASFWTFGAIAIVTLLLKADIARGYLAVALPVGTLGLVISRRAWRGSVSRRRSEGRCPTRVLAFGDRNAVVELVDEMTKNPRDGYQIVGIGIPGYCEPRGECLSVGGRDIPIVGGEANMLDAIHTSGADTVALAGTDFLGVRGMRRLVWDLDPMGVDLVVATGAMDVALSRLVMRPMAGLPLLHIEKPQYRGSKRFQKRAFDFWFAMVVLIGAAPILLVAAIAIKLGDRGPILYASERIGIGGEPFLMFKFRTMVPDADKQLGELTKDNESDGVLFKIRDDPRVTSVGRILRRLSVDELPQFVNVIRNEMSVVGPRPPLRREADAYDCDVLRRLLVKPGITGLWQVSGRSDLSWTDSVRLDLSYVDNWSMVGDLLIVMKTLGAVMQRRGAY
jgi:exopolysaccharide biosynthesis polyprenyl glycosylphosphotransferase